MGRRDEGRDVNGETTSTLVILTVPKWWASLSVEEIAEKIRERPEIALGLAAEIKRWSDTSALDLTALKKFIEERTDG